ncbi:Unknown protein sequence [Pseudomonas coronafaciens pv. garcae]|nr:Unknown protein sequence [Pseudomonas coronafaciens pv. garcae]RMT00375.1 hypothetical protein ALP56_04778 [Pseudomonas coronafaciens pv. oryzae]RMV66084.1 hypothetical protein ALP06_05325 [Pseudomonas coronafaciens pv. atropurpurea]RMV90026.1 hypothetical protein ALP02_04228 [Pseudomonas coronafaciens pv. garcae]
MVSLKSCAFRAARAKSTYYRYDERHYLVAVTDALDNTTL